MFLVSTKSNCDPVMCPTDILGIYYSVPEPSHFGTDPDADPDPRIRTSD
jgi:hypothetical protein